MKNHFRNHLIFSSSSLQGEPEFRKDRRFLLCLLSVIIWGLVTHGYGFLHSSFSHDSLNALYADNVEELCKLSGGRFFIPIYRLFRGGFALPWLVGLLSLLFIGLSLYLIVRMLKLRNPLSIVLTAGIMTTNLTVTAQTATYIHELDCNCLAMLFAVCTAYLWYCYRGWLPILAGTALIFLSASIYQSYITTAITLMILLCVVDLYRDVEITTVVLHGFHGIVILLLGMAVYFGFSTVFFRLSDVPNLHPVHIPTQLSSAGIIELIGGAYRDCFMSLHNTAYHRLFLPILYLTDILLVVSLIRCLLEKRKDPLRIALMAVLLLLLPLGMNATYIPAGGKEVHVLMHYSIWFIFLLYLLAAFRPCPKACHSGKLLCVGLIGLILWQNVLIANTAYMKKEMAEKATLSVITRVLDRLEQREDYVLGETNVAFVGTGSGIGKMLEYGSVSNLGGLSFNSSIAVDSSNTFYNCYRAYFRYVLNYPIALCDDGIREELARSEEVAQMPAFPDPNCIQMINGSLVVKMGE